LQLAGRVQAGDAVADRLRLRTAADENAALQVGSIVRLLRFALPTSATEPSATMIFACSAAPDGC